MASSDRAYCKGTVPVVSNEKKSDKINLTMQLMGIPYQFLPSVDQRIPGVSSKIGRKFLENIIMEAPTITIIPGKPRYLPGTKDKVSVTNALIEASNSNFKELKQLQLDGETVRLYDFQACFIEYMQYVNILNRSAAGFLELGDVDYRINGSKVNFLNYDWKNYRWNGKGYASTTAKFRGAINKAIKEAATDIANTSIGQKVTSAAQKALTSAGKLVSNITGKQISFVDSEAAADEAELDAKENVLRRTNYIQFYTDVQSAGITENESNSTQQSSFKQMLDQGSSAMRDIAFLLNSGTGDAGDKMQALGDSTLSALNQALGGGGSVNGEVGSLVSRLLTSGRSVIRGDSISMPDIWGGSDMSKSYTVTLNFKAPYGNRLAFYTDIMVPVNFCIALAYPKATSANSYASPFLIKMYQKGGAVCNLGMITGIDIAKNVVPESRNADGLCTEVTVTLNITDLDPDMAISPANDPALFLSNSSLVEYLANSCGLDLMEPQVMEKAKLIWNTSFNAVKNYASTSVGMVSEKLNEAIYSFTGL